MEIIWRFGYCRRTLFFHWRRKLEHQAKKRDEIEDAQAVMNLSEASEKQNEERIRNKLIEAKIRFSNTDRRLAMSKYRSIETEVFETMRKKYGEYIVRHNILLNHSEFDIIMYSEKERCFKVIEIKYYPNNIGYDNYKRGYEKFILTFIEFKDYFEITEFDKRSVEYILLWISPNADKLQEYKKQLLDESIKPKVDIKITTEDKIADLEL
jgi:hypothetical protein